jgi:hypothetical protein
VGRFFSQLSLYLLISLLLEKLAAESPAAREEIILLTLPYVVLPHRVRHLQSPSIQHPTLFI